MTFLAPEWFFFIPLLILTGWKFKFLRFHEPLRFLLLLTLLTALSRPTMQLGNGEMDVWLLVDQSDSTLKKTVPAGDEIYGLLNQSKRSGDGIRVVDFARDAVLREKGDPQFTGSTASTRIGNAIDYVLAQADTEKLNRLLIVTDGYPTDSLDSVIDKLKTANTAVDSRTIPHSFAVDFSIEDVKYPSRVRPGEAFLVEFDVVSSEKINASIPWKIQRGDLPPLTGTAELENGKARVRITDRITSSGSVPYKMSIAPDPADPISPNNFADIWIEAAGGSRILLISTFSNDPIALFLKNQGFDVSLITEPSKLNKATLTGAKLVILNNVPASKVPTDFLSSLNFFVNEQGGGLLMCGGKNSFGSGGYFSSPIDALLPVSMELRNEHRKLVTAMAVVLDRSGSMSVSAGGGRTKMDLANSGTITAIQQLSDMDFVSIHAVDSTPHAIAPMCQVGPNRDQLIKAASRIESTGGGIFVEEGIRAGWHELLKAQVGTRHLILFSDASDSEEPGRYADYLAAMQQDGISVSVIALGTEKDSDAKLLEEIAFRGGGRLFFSKDGNDLPGIFAQETVSIARSAYIKETTPLTPTPGWAQLAPKAPNWPAAVDAYNLSYLKEGATSACISQDEYSAPLVAFWSRGAGRTAAISFPMGGDDAANLLKWNGYGDFIQTLSRWLMGNGSPEGFALNTRLEGEYLTLELLYSDANIASIAKQAPKSSIEITVDGQPRIIEGVWEHIEPGKFTCGFLLEKDDLVRGAIKIDQYTIPFGPISSATNPEWDMSKNQKDEFMKLVNLSGGKERNDITEIWNEPRTVKQREFTLYLVWAAFGLAILDALLSRLGISLLPRKKRAAAPTDSPAV